MRYLILAALVAMLSACAETTLPVLASYPSPDDVASPTANLPYRPVMAGTAYQGVGSQP